MGRDISKLQMDMQRMMVRVPTDAVTAVWLVEFEQKVKQKRTLRNSVETLLIGWVGCWQNS